MKLINTRCAICGASSGFTIVYKQNFSESSFFSEDKFSARKIPDYIHYQIVRCNKDNLIRSNPVLDETDANIFYEKSKFTYEEEIENLTVSYLNALKTILSKLSKNAKILEVGCGNGFILKVLYDLGYENIFGIEPCSDAVKRADKIIQGRILEDVLHQESFEENVFDLIFFFQTFDHIQNPDRFLEMCYNLLKSGGFILAFNHDVESLQARILRDKSPIIDIGHAYLYSKATIKKIFEKNAFKTIKVYSPYNFVSLKHLIRLLPLPKSLKIRFINTRNPFIRFLLKRRIKIRLGNLCFIGTRAL